TQNFSASTPLRTGSDSNSSSSECSADFASCTLNNTTRPPLCRANAAAYFSAACAFAEKSVGKRMFLNGNIYVVLCALIFVRVSRYERMAEQRTKFKEQSADSLFPFQFPDFHAKLRKLSYSK